MMAATAKYRDDIAGAIVTGGTSTAYTITSYQVFDTLAHLNGQMIAFTPNATSANTIGNDVTLNVDGLGAKPIRPAPSVVLPGGSLISGTPYVVTYNNSDGAFYLQGGLANAYSIPLGAGLDYWGATTPNSAFAFPAGQAISRTTYASLFSLFSTNYGSGDGSTTFNLPDLRGRVVAALDNMGGSAASRLTSTYFGVHSGFAATSLGATGGQENEALSLAQLPTGITSTNLTGISVSVTSTANNVDLGTSVFGAASGGNNISTVGGAGSVTSTGTIPSNNVTLTSNNTSGNGHANVQPTIVCNYILRVI